MKNSRRDFLKKLPIAMSIPFTMGGIPIRIMGQDAPLTQIARTAAGFPSDRVLVILQLHGGNDGLNTLIPVEAYDQYYLRRRNIAIPKKSSLRKYIPLDTTLPSANQVGLHPDMGAMKSLYDQGRVTIVQGVSYANNNGSHFRGRDIQFMGGSAEEYLTSGWASRYIQEEINPRQYPGEPVDFPNADFPDPLAIEMGNDTSLIFHQEQSIPLSIAINDPIAFEALVNGLEGFLEGGVDPRGIPPAILNNSPYFKEMQWLLNLETQSKSYASRMAQVYSSVNATTVSYPEKYPLNAPQGSIENNLSAQLRFVARMLRGGSTTKVFLVRLGGFDTHAEQVESYDSTMGSHAALMYHMSTAMKAFQQDLATHGLEDRVLTVTTSEFGRRISSNGSYGTDHGTGGPMFVFGKGVEPGVVGHVPDMSDGVHNVGMQRDYREVYAKIVHDWLLHYDTPQNKFDKTNRIFEGIMTPTGTIIDEVKFDPSLPIIRTGVITGTEGFLSSRFVLRNCYPNPVKGKTTFSFKVNTANHVVIDLMDTQGKKVKVITADHFAPGDHLVESDLSDVPAGSYIYELRSGSFKQARKLVIEK